MKKTLIYLQHNLVDIQIYELPEGYRYVRYERGFENQWASILLEAGEFDSHKDGLRRFHREFSNTPDLDRYMIFIENENEDLVGTVTAWHGTVKDRLRGRLHWFNIIPESQGKGLGMALLSKGMTMLQDNFDEAFLKVHVNNNVMINLFISMGWKPLIVHPWEIRIWVQSGYHN